jgi:hypothetical protein
MSLISRLIRIFVAKAEIVQLERQQRVAGHRDPPRLFSSLLRLSRSRIRPIIGRL